MEMNNDLNQLLLPPDAYDESTMSNFKISQNNSLEPKDNFLAVKRPGRFESGMIELDLSIQGSATKSKIHAEVVDQSIHQESRIKDEKLIFTYISKLDFRNLKIHLHNITHNNHDFQGQTGSTGFFIDITKVYDKKGLTPLHFASFSNSLKCVQILSEHVL